MKNQCRVCREKTTGASVKVLGILSFLILFLTALLPLSLQAQNKSDVVSGKIFDSSGSPLIGATIVIKNSGTHIGTIADMDGEFRIEAKQGDVLEVSYIGYLTKTYTIDSRTKDIIIVLEEAATSVNEVVVIGYGTQKKETMTGAVSVVKSDAVIASPTANVSNALVGRVTGISSVQSSGEPGDNHTTLRIRGVATLNGDGQDPLVVIDGIQSTIEQMNVIDANEIASISVLKDASATAVYGVKGANGVIIVTTKRGNSGKPRINLSYRFGLTEITSKLQMLDSYHYALLRNEAIANDGVISKNPLLFSESEIWKFQANRDYTPDEVDAMDFLSETQKEALKNSPALYYRSEDDIEKQFGGTAPQQQYNINISGGKEKVNYFASVGYLSQKGMFKNAVYQNVNNNSLYERYNFRSNIDVDITGNLKLSVNLGGSFQNGQGLLGKDGSDLTDASSRHKEMLVMILSGSPFSGPGMLDGKLVDGYIATLNPLNGRGSSGNSSTAYLITRSLLKTRTSDLTSTIRLKYNIDWLTRGLSLAGTVSYNDTYQKSRTETRYPEVYKAGRNPNNPNELLFYGGSTQPTGVNDNQNVYNNRRNSLYLEARVEYARTFDRHAFTGLLLYNAQQWRDPSLEFLVPSGMIGSAVRVTYSFDNRYLAEINIGYNGSENFPKGKRFGFFPAYSVGWIATNEKFIPQNDILTLLKLRASYGEVGNDKIGGRRFLYLPSTWSYLNNMQNGYGAYFGYSDGSAYPVYYEGAYESRLGNPDVTWERAKKTNIGVDVNFFKNRLSVVGEIFNEDRTGILWSYGSSPAYIGATPPMGNIGKVNNKGYEIQATWKHEIEDFYYSIGAGASYAVNKILYCDEPSNPYEWMNMTGFAINQYKGLISDGFYNDYTAANNRPYSSVDGNKVQAGDIRFVDLNGDGVIDSKDEAPIGYSNLPKYSFNGTIDLEYKGFTLSALFTGSYGGSMRIASHYMLNPFYMDTGSAQIFHYTGRWTPEKAAAGEDIFWPRASLRNENTQNGQSSDLYLRSTQYLKLKNLEFAYTFHGGRLETWGLSGIKLYVSGNNLYTWFSKLLPGYDPEQADSGGAADGYLYPPTRSYNIGFNIQF